MRKQLRLQKNKGFTLVELLVAAAIFLTTVVSLSQIFINTLKLESRAYSILIAENNIRNSVDFMSRLIRMGMNFQVDIDHRAISFDYYSPNKSSNTPDRITYRYEDEENSQNIVMEKNNQRIGYLFNEEVKVTDAKFYEFSNAQLPQKTIIMVLTTQTKVPGLTTPFEFKIQTAVTPRLFNL